MGGSHHITLTFSFFKIIYTTEILIPIINEINN